MNEPRGKRNHRFVVTTVTMIVVAALSGCSRSERESPSQASPASDQPTIAQPASSSAAMPEAKSNAAVNPRFVDIAADAGMTTPILCGGTNKNHILESTGSGCALLDYDEDGLLDAFVVNAWALEGNPQRIGTRGRNLLYRNRGDGTFEEVGERAGVANQAWGCGVCAADYDHDGHVDLYVTNFGPNCLYRNRGDGTFEEVAQRAGVADAGWGAGAAFFDADHDGDLDLYLANYIDCTFDEVLAAERTNTWRDKVKVMAGPFGLRGGRDRFFRNRGDGTFEDATDEVGMSDTAESYGLGVLASDLDADGDVDVYVTNDSNPNFLYRNDGDGHFTEVGTWSGAGVSAEGKAQAGMGVDAADLDGDGLPEVLVTNFAKDYATLYHNDGKLFFSDVSGVQGIKKLSYDPVKWGCTFFDFDSDGDSDILILNGHIYPQVDSEPSLAEHFRQPPTLLRNDPKGWADATNSAGPGMQIPISGRGLAVGDIDNDGDLDLLATAIDAPPLLLRNDTPAQGHWLQVRLLNANGSPAINARALVTVGGKTQLREVRSGSTYASQSSFTLHFGLGPATEVEKLEVIWPSGKRTLREHVPVDQQWTLREDST